MEINCVDRKFIGYFLSENFVGRLFILLLAKMYPDFNTFYTCLLLWGIVACFWLLHLKAFTQKSDYNFVIFGPPEKFFKPETQKLIAAAGIIVLSALAYRFIFDAFKLEYLFKSHMEQFGNLGLLSCFAQIIYYIAEIIIITLIAVRVQDLSPQKRWFIPYGGIFLAATWGFSRFLTGSSLAGNIFMDFNWSFSDMFSPHVLNVGFYYVIISLLVGILPILFKGDNRWILPIAATLYIL